MSGEEGEGVSGHPRKSTGEGDALGRMRELAAIVESSADAIISLSPEGLITSWNRGAERAFGYSELEMIGQPCDRLVSGGDTGDLQEWLARAGEGESLRSQEARWVQRDGSTLFVSVTTSPMLDERHRVYGVSAVIRDITYRKEAESRLRYLADHDALTNLQNRRRFGRELRRELKVAQRFGARGAVMVIDLDAFKAINDELGHRVGDQLICRIAEVLRRSLRDVDIVARIGGDEFAVFLPDGDHEEVARKLIQTIRQTALGLGDDWIRTTASIGVARVTRERLTEEELLARADVAMYEAKEAGRDGYRIYHSDETQQRRGRQGQHMSERIREAVDGGAFEAFVQPVYDMSLGRVCQHELLIRMRDSAGQLVLPAAFLPTADRFGLIENIDRWMVTRAVRLLRDFAEDDLPVCLEVNLSARSMADQGLVPLIETELEESGVDPQRLIFEVTETSVIENLDDALALAGELRRIGCRFALDDFGAGFGSFHYLKNLPFDFIKIDGDFIRRLPSNETDQYLVEAITRLAGRLDKKTIAEFVEDVETMELLSEFGVDYAQGYHVGRPHPVEDLDQKDLATLSLG